jgi:hypothetical protein
MPLRRKALWRVFLLSCLLTTLFIAIALWLGGCDDRTDSHRPHCDMLYERGHAQPCRRF